MDVSGEANGGREKMYSSLVDSLGSDEVFALRQQNHNNQLLDQLTNRLEVEKILEVNNRLVQKSDPIYMMPESNWGRAHFYAPFKVFNGQLTDTKWFNLTILWTFTFLAYITLLLDLLRRLISNLNSLILRKQS
jgi:hypothetical protein